MGPSSNNAHGISLYPTHKAPGIVDIPKMQCQTWLWPHPRSLVWGTPWKVFLHTALPYTFRAFRAENCCCWTRGILDCRVPCCSVLPPFMCVSVFDNRFRNFGCSREKFRIGYCERWSE
jgi:hypothetical protein